MNKKLLCGQCMKMVKKSDMWSDYTCKKCAVKLGFVIDIRCPDCEHYLPFAEGSACKLEKCSYQK